MDAVVHPATAISANGTRAAHDAECDNTAACRPMPCPPAQAGTADTGRQADAGAYDPQAFLDMVLANHWIGVTLVDMQGQVLDINAAALDMLDAQSADQVMERGLLPLIGQRHQPAWEALLDRVRHGECCHMEFRFMSLAGRLRSFVVQAAPLPSSSERDPCMLLLTNDTTCAQPARPDVDKLHADLINAREREQARIAQEIHDNYGQELAHIAFRLQDAFNHLPRRESKLRATLQDLWADCRNVASELLQLSYRYSPMKLRQLGLQGALQSLCRQSYEEHQLPVSFVCQNLPGAIDENIELCLYRIAQEAFSNIWKHSESADAVIELYGEPGAINLNIDDFGIGFNPGEESVTGLGLARMRQRALLLGGKVTVAAARGEGVSISVNVPFESARQQPRAGTVAVQEG